MKITIDTKEDSHSELRKVISMLQALVGESEDKTYSNRDIFSDPSPEVTPSAAPSEPSGVFGNLFDSDKSDIAEASETTATEETKEEPESDDNVEVIPY